jgi:arginase
MNNIDIIGYNSGHGAQIQGCKDGALSLQAAGLEKFLNKFNLNAKWKDLYHSHLEGTNATPLRLVVDYCDKLSAQVAESIKTNRFPLTIGGDHTMAIGTWRGVAEALSAKGEFGLVWLDAHMDSHTPETSETGAYHGMPLAALMGHGEAALCSGGAVLKPEHVCLVGVRSFEEGEAALLKKLGVRIFYMPEIQQKGLHKVIEEAVAIATNGTKGYGVSIDLDVFDPEFAPATGSLAAGGIALQDAISSFARFGCDNKLKALEIAEYNPNLVGKEQTEQLILKVIKVILA